MSEESKHGVESLKKAMSLLAKNLVLGIEIGKGGLDASDVQHAPKVFENLKEIILFVSSKPELVDEIKDLDVSEGFELVAKAWEEAKKVLEEIKE